MLPLNKLEKRLVNVTNPNPVGITVTGINMMVASGNSSNVRGGDGDSLLVKLVGVFSPTGGLASTQSSDARLLITQKQSVKSASFSFTLPPLHTLVLSAEIHSSREQDKQGKLSVVTEGGELVFPISFMSVEGMLSIEELHEFEPLFPGRTVGQPVSSYPEQSPV